MSQSSIPNTPPVEVAAQFFTGLNEPRPLSLDFSLDGLFGVSAHQDGAVRVVDVQSMTPATTIVCDTFGVSSCRFTQSSGVLCTTPSLPLDGHLYLLDVERGTYIAALAYVNDLEQEVAVTQKPVYSTLSQCPVSDVIASVIAAKGALTLFHPLVSGAVAVSPDGFVKGANPAVSFSPDGNTILVGGEERLQLLDRRKLSSVVRSIPHQQIFRSNPSRCRGAEVSASGQHILATSSKGEVVVLNAHTGEAELSYFHHDVTSFFSGAVNYVGARYATPCLDNSRVVQMTSSMNGGRHLLVYRPPQGGGQQEAMQYGSLEFQLQSKDSEVPVAITVNPRYQVVATAARYVTWWAFTE